MKPPRKPPDVAGAVSAISKAKARGRGRKSPVFLWLLARHDELEAAFKENAPSWPALAEYLGQGGVMSGDGTMPTATSVQNAWLRVRKHVATRREASSRPAAVSSPAQAHSPPAQPLRQPVVKPHASSEGPSDARPASTDRRFAYDPIVREGEAEDLLGDLHKPRRK